jgi:hypothetical protein
LFNLFFDVCCRLHKEGLAAYFLIEELRSEKRDHLLAHRFHVGVNNFSFKYISFSSTPGNADSNGVAADDSGNADAGEGDNANSSQNGDGVANLSKFDKIQLTIDKMFAEGFKRATVPGKAADKKRKRNAPVPKVSCNNENLSAYISSLRKYMFDYIEDGDEGDILEGGEHRNKVEDLLSLLEGKAENDVYTASREGASEVFSLKNCIFNDDVTKYNRRYDVDQESGKSVYDRIDRIQCIISNYYDVNEITEELEPFSGIVYPFHLNDDDAPSSAHQEEYVKCRTMKVSIDHLHKTTTDVLPAPGKQYDDFVERHAVKLTKEHAIELSSENLKFFTKNTSTMGMMNPRLKAAIESNDEDSTRFLAIAKPDEHYDDQVLKDATTSTTFDVPTDPLVLKQKFAYENPRDIAIEMREDDIDVQRLAQHKCKLAKLVASQTVLKGTKQSLCDEIQKARDSASNDFAHEVVVAGLIAELQSVVSKDIKQDERVHQLRWDIENASCSVSEKALSRAVAAANAKDTEKLSEAQIACFLDENKFMKAMPMECIMADVNRDLSPIANWLNEVTYTLDEIYGVHTHHPQTIFIICAGKTAFIAEPVLRVHTLQSGPAQAGKDFAREVAQCLSPKGVYVTKSSTTEAARVDMNRRLEAGMVFCYSETPSWMMNTDKPDPATEAQKKSCTECLLERTKFVDYETSKGGDMEKHVTRVRVDARSAMIVNSNDGSGQSSGTHSQSHSHDALLSRFVRLSQSVPRRKHQDVKEGDKVAKDVDDRLYANTSNLSEFNPLPQAKGVAEHRFHHNVVFHSTVNFLISLGTIPKVDMTVFELVRPRVTSLLNHYYRISEGARYTQQARDFAYVLSIDDWWIRHFMTQGGPFVRDGGAGVSGKNGRVSTEQLVRAVHRKNIACTEEIALFAWQMMMSTGVVSHSLLSSVCNILLHYINYEANEENLNLNAAEDKSVLTCLRYYDTKNAEKIRSKLSASLEDDEDNDGFATESLNLEFELFDGFTKYNYERESYTDEVSAMRDFCNTLTDHDDKFCLMDTKYSSLQMEDALMTIISKQYSYSVPNQAHLEFRRKDESSASVSVFQCVPFIQNLIEHLSLVQNDTNHMGFTQPDLGNLSDVAIDSISTIYTAMTKESTGVTKCLSIPEVVGGVHNFLHVYKHFEQLEGQCLKTVLCKACIFALRRALGGELNAFSQWTGARVMLRILAHFDENHVFLPHWVPKSTCIDTWKERLSTCYDAHNCIGSTTDLDTHTITIHDCGVPAVALIDWKQILTFLSMDKIALPSMVAINKSLESSQYADKLLRLFEANLHPWTTHSCSKFAQEYLQNRDGDNQGTPLGGAEQLEANEATDAHNREYQDRIHSELQRQQDPDVKNSTRMRPLIRFKKIEKKTKGGLEKSKETKHQYRYAIEIDIQCAQYWAKESHYSSIQEEFVRHYQHSASVEGEIALHVTKAGYNSLRTMRVQKSKEMLFCKNPQYVARDVSERLIAGVDDDVKEKWSKECTLMHMDTPVDEWAQSLRHMSFSLKDGEEDAPEYTAYMTDWLMEHPYVHLKAPSFIYGKPKQLVVSSGTTARTKIGETSNTVHTQKYMQTTKDCLEFVQSNHWSH